MSDNSDGRIVLYEGNFTDWEQQTSRVFIAEDRPEVAYPATAHPASASSPAIYHTSNFGDISISANVLARIPSNLQLGVGPLYAWLEKFCTPFRILDLPPELRVNIYEQVMVCDPVQSIGYPTDGQSRSRLPALAHTNRQLHNEVLPVYLSNSTFTLAVHNGGRRYMLHRLENWDSAILNGAAKFLRRLHVTVRANCRSSGRVLRALVPLHIRYREHDSSLELCTRPDMTKESMDTLQGFVKDLSKTQGLRGESVLVLGKQLCTEGQSLAHFRTQNWLDLLFKDGAKRHRGFEDETKIVQLRVALSK